MPEPIMFVYLVRSRRWGWATIAQWDGVDTFDIAGSDEGYTTHQVEVVAEYALPVPEGVQVDTHRFTLVGVAATAQGE